MYANHGQRLRERPLNAMVRAWTFLAAGLLHRTCRHTQHGDDSVNVIENHCKQGEPVVPFEWEALHAPRIKAQSNENRGDDRHDDWQNEAMSRPWRVDWDWSCIAIWIRRPRPLGDDHAGGLSRKKERRAPAQQRRALDYTMCNVKRWTRTQSRS